MIAPILAAKDVNVPKVTNPATLIFAPVSSPIVVGRLTPSSSPHQANSLLSCDLYVEVEMTEEYAYEF